MLYCSLWCFLLFSCKVVSDSLATQWTIAHQAPLSMGFSRQRYWSGLPFPSPWDLSDPRVKPRSLLHWGRFFTIWELPGNPLRYLKLSPWNLPIFFRFYPSCVWYPQSFRCMEFWRINKLFWNFNYNSDYCCKLLWWWIIFLCDDHNNIPSLICYSTMWHYLPARSEV